MGNRIGVFNLAGPLPAGVGMVQARAICRWAKGACRVRTSSTEAKGIRRETLHQIRLKILNAKSE